MTKRELEIGKLLYPRRLLQPKTRANAPRGRARARRSCKHHLFIDVSPRTGAIKLNFPDLEVWELGESCALRHLGPRRHHFGRRWSDHEPDPKNASVKSKSKHRQARSLARHVVLA